MTVTKFNVGQTYSGRFICNHDTIANFTIVSRTAKTIKTLVHGKLVSRRVSKYCGREQFSPFGSYSMSMVIDANDPDLTQAAAAPADSAKWTPESARRRVGGTFGT